MKENMKPDIEDPEFRTLVGVIAMSLFIGFVRVLLLLRKGRRKLRWFDLILEPCLALVAGLTIYLLCEATQIRGPMQLVMSNLGAWGGPRTLHWLERKYLGGSRRSDEPTVPGELM